MPSARELAGLDLVLRPAVEVRDLARAAGQLLRDPGHLLLGDVPVVAVERLAGDRLGVGVQQQFDGAGDVGGVDLLAPFRRGDRLAAQHLADEVVPAAGPGRVGQAVDAGRPQGADRPALAQAVAVDERLQRRLVRPVMARRPQRVGFVQRPVGQDHLVDGAGGDEHEARHTGLEGGLEELQRAGEVDAEEDVGRTVTAAAPIARAFPLHGRVDHGVRAPDQFAVRPPRPPASRAATRWLG